MTNWTPTLPEDGPRYLAIAEAIASDIETARLRPGDRLPTHRDLAWSLGVTIGTVTRGYAEAKRRGLINAEVGRGSYVRDPAVDGSFAIGGNHASERAPGRVDLDYAVPPRVAAHAALRDSLADLSQDPDCLDLLSYPPTAGYPSHRAAAAAWLRRHGLELSPDRVVMTSGAHHAIVGALVALTRPGDRLLVEPLTYPGIQPIARLLGLRLEAVACDDQGLLPDALESACRGGRAAALYCVPTLQNPTTATLSAERREAIAEIAERYGLPVIEDELLRPLAEAPPPPITALLPDLGFHVTSLSKAAAPGLRVGILAGPAGQAERLARAVYVTASKPPALAMEIARRWIEDGTAEDILGQIKRELAARRELALRLLAGHDFLCPPGSLYGWLTLPAGRQDAEFAAATLHAGAVVTTSQPFAVQARERLPAVRLCLGGPADAAQLARGLAAVAGQLSAQADEIFDDVV